MHTLPTSILLFNSYSIFFCSYFLLVIAVAAYVYYKNPNLDRVIFLIFGIFLILFTLFRPLSLSRDDLAYIGIAKSICALDECGFILQGNRDWLWYFGISLLKSVRGDETSLMILAGISVAIKLFAIDRICKQRLIALALLIPLIYIQYDFTQLRAGLALSWYFIGILFLTKKRLFLSSGFMGSNFITHTQALPSIALLPMYWLNRKKWMVPTSTIFFTCLIYFGLFPNLTLMEKLQFFNMGATPYLMMAASGEYANVKVFPLGYLPILGYALWLCWGIDPTNDRLIRIVGGTIVLATVLAWFLSSGPTMQTRMFEFYIAPIILLAGNIGSSKAKLIGTIILATTLYLRLEFFSDWILG